MIEIVRAAPEEAPRLKEIAIASKGHWGYDRAWLEQWRQRLTFTEEHVRTQHVYVARQEGKIIGWYALLRRGDTFVLDHLWVLPEHIGKGIGRRLFEHARRLAEAEGGAFLELEADPNARGFYARMGLRYLRETAGDMGRSLPIMGMALGGASPRGV